MSPTAALSLLLVSQVAVEHPPDLDALQAAIEQAAAKRPSVEVVLALTQGTVAPSLAEDLQRFDWLEAGTWSYRDRQPSETFGKTPWRQYDWNRYLPGGGALRFQWSPGAVGPGSGVTHVNFELPPRSSMAVERRKKTTWLVNTAYGEKAYLRVVSYVDGVLVFDITKGGKASSRDPAFRTVHVAMPRLFESAGQ